MKLAAQQNGGAIVDAMIGKKKEWCCWGGLNSRPQPYQGCALPLSYSSQPFRWPDWRKAGPGRGALLAVPPCFVKREAVSAGKLPMRKDDNLSREERLAAKLRENLRRRKDQARAISGGNPPLPKDPDPR